MKDQGQTEERAKEGKREKKKKREMYHRGQETATATEYIKEGQYIPS